MPTEREIDPDEIPDEISQISSMEPEFTEYETSSEETWRVDAWDELSKDFNLTLSDMRGWHDAFAGQGRMWLILRRTYFVAALFNAQSLEDVDHRRWTASEIASDLGIKKHIVKEELKNAVDFWTKKKSGARMSAAVKSITADETESDPDPNDIPTMLDMYDDIPEDQIESILKQVGFSHVKNKSHRLAIADRVIHLRELFQDKNKRVNAHRLISLEVTMYSYEEQKIAIRNQIDDEKMAEDADESKKKSDTHKKNLEDRLRLLESALDKAATQHGTLAEKLHIQDTDEDHLKQQFTGAISLMIESRRAYYANEDNKLFDNVFTEREFLWQTEPQGPRKAQYRPDIVLSLIESLKEENLFDPDYNSNIVNRESTKRFLKIMNAFSDSMDNEEKVIEGVDDLTMEAASDSTTTMTPQDAAMGAIASNETPVTMPPASTFQPGRKKSGSMSVS